MITAVADTECIRNRYSSISHHTFALGFHRLLWPEQIGILVFSMSYEMKFKAAIRGHHVYKATWSPVMNKKLICKKDNRQEAHEYDSNAVGVY